MFFQAAPFFTARTRPGPFFDPAAVVGEEAARRFNIVGSRASYRRFRSAQLNRQREKNSAATPAAIASLRLSDSKPAALCVSDDRLKKFQAAVDLRQGPGAADVIANDVLRRKKTAAGAAAATADTLRAALKPAPEGYKILLTNQILEAIFWIGSGGWSDAD